MTSLKVFALLFIFQCVVMFVSYELDHEVWKESLMVLYISGLLVVGSLFGKMYTTKNIVEVEDKNIYKVLIISSIVFSATLLYKLYMNLEGINLSTYKTFRETFLMSIFGFSGTINKMSLYILVIFSGILLAQIIKNEEPASLVRSLFVIILCMSAAIIFTGSRSIIVLFFISVFIGIPNIKCVLKSKITPLFLLITVCSLLVLGVVRDIPVMNIFIPLDSFLVGPHLLHQNIDRIETVLNERSVPPGYALFSGFYVQLTGLLELLGINEFKWHLEKVFWFRHQFQEVEVFSKPYNSYYTAGLAVVIEGWLIVGIMSYNGVLVPTNI